MEGMYAVYGLAEDRESVERYLGYVYAEYLTRFTDTSGWDVKFLTMPDGTQRLGWRKGRAFFCDGRYLRANPDEVEWYLQDHPGPFIRSEPHLLQE